MRTSDLRLSREISGSGEQAGNEPTVGVTSNFASRTQSLRTALDPAGPHCPGPLRGPGLVLGHLTLTTAARRRATVMFRCCRRSPGDEQREPAPTMQKRALAHRPLL